MTDMAAVIVPKSDQLNADDLIAGPRTIRIEGVTVRPGTEQPVDIRIVGERKFYRPCKSMCRVMVAAWGADSAAYAGKSLTIYRDPKVKWGGLEVGGIRISEMSHIDRELVMALTEKKGSRKPHIVKPLRGARQQTQSPPSPEATLPAGDAGGDTSQGAGSGAAPGHDAQALVDEADALARPLQDALNEAADAGDMRALATAWKAGVPSIRRLREIAPDVADVLTAHKDRCKARIEAMGEGDDA